MSNDDTTYHRPNEPEQALNTGTPIRLSIDQVWKAFWGVSGVLVAGAVAISASWASLKYDLKDLKSGQEANARDVASLRSELVVTRTQASADLAKVTADTREETRIIRAEVVKTDTLLAEQIKERLTRTEFVNVHYRLARLNPAMIFPETDTR